MAIMPLKRNYVNRLSGTSKKQLFLDVPLQFLTLWAAKYAFFSGKSLKTEVFRDSLSVNAEN
ncbi:MAG: hypothetical protein LBB72_00685 [Spirochaetaceae bacterium]|jgi:hypothetical protein|nr:hypothetical protein [Spirochaetaceae bacterium]